jgi:hypothetical protein
LVTLEPVNVFRRISRAISRFSNSPTAPIPGGGATATQVEFEQVEAVEQQEFPPEEEREQESE